MAGADDFKSAFLSSYGMWLIIDWYDSFFLDWVLFVNIKCIRLPGTEHMDKAYHQKKYHFTHSLIGMMLGLIPCLLTGFISVREDSHFYRRPLKKWYINHINGTM